MSPTPLMRLKNLWINLIPKQRLKPKVFDNIPKGNHLYPTLSTSASKSASSTSTTNSDVVVVADAVVVAGASSKSKAEASIGVSGLRSTSSSGLFGCFFSVPVVSGISGVVVADAVDVSTVKSKAIGSAAVVVVVVVDKVVDVAVVVRRRGGRVGASMSRPELVVVEVLLGLVFFGGLVVSVSAEPFDLTSKTSSGFLKGV